VGHLARKEDDGVTCGKTGWQVDAHCLMPNPLHLAVETPQANLVEREHVKEHPIVTNSG
jgi:hypothetical protein